MYRLQKENLIMETDLELRMSELEDEGYKLLEEISAEAEEKPTSHKKKGSEDESV